MIDSDGGPHMKRGPEDGALSPESPCNGNEVKKAVRAIPEKVKDAFAPSSWQEALDAVVERELHQLLNSLEWAGVMIEARLRERFTMTVAPVVAATLAVRRQGLAEDAVHGLEADLKERPPGLVGFQDRVLAAEWDEAIRLSTSIPELCAFWEASGKPDMARYLRQYADAVEKQVSSHREEWGTRKGWVGGVASQNRTELWTVAFYAGRSGAGVVEASLGLLLAAKEGLFPRAPEGQTGRPRGLDVTIHMALERLLGKQLPTKEQALASWVGSLGPDEERRALTAALKGIEAGEWGSPRDPYVTLLAAAGMEKFTRILKEEAMEDPLPIKQRHLGVLRTTRAKAEKKGDFAEKYVDPSRSALLLVGAVRFLLYGDMAQVNLPGMSEVWFTDGEDGKGAVVRMDP